MSQDVFIFEVTEKNFASVVVENSHKLPVVVAFMGVWSEHCFGLDGVFSSLAKEFAGRFIFAKVDIDEQPELRRHYQIENVPTLLLFNHGEIVRAEAGLLQEPEARALLRELGISHASDEMREQARAKHLAGDTTAAVLLLTQAIQSHPANTRVAMDMVQIFIDIGDLANARGLLARLPEQDRNSDVGKALSGQVGMIEAASRTAGIEALQARLLSHPNDAQPRFDLAICLIATHEYPEAMDQLLHIVKNAPDFREGAAREMMIGVIRTLTPGNPELAQQYQRKFSNLVAQ